MKDSHDIVSFSKDINLRMFLKKVPTAYFHIFFWLFFITYEVSLAGAITKKLGHPLDYALHYALNIGLFYFHCFRVLNPNIGGQRRKWKGLFYLFIAELILFFISGLLISKCLEILQIEKSWNFRDGRFIYGNIYRCIYMLSISTAYWFGLNHIRNLKRIYRMERTGLIREKLKLQTEVALLKATINPHMLFNTLNFLYNEVRKIDKPIAEHIMALSEIMGFALLDISKGEKVILHDELRYIENYIHLYKQRIPINILIVKEGLEFHFQQKVIPLILATLTENIFQHGDLSCADKPALVAVKCQSGLLEIQTENQIYLEANPGHGLGLANLEKRLQNAYPDSYEYSNVIENNIYKSRLKINLN